MAQETSAPDTHSGPTPHSSEQEAGPPVAETGASVRRVPLPHLLSVVELSPAQASLVAAQLLDGIHVEATRDGAQPADGFLWAVALTPAADVEVARAQAGEGSPATELLRQLSQNARRLPAHPRAEQVFLLRKLEEVAADPLHEPGARARDLEGALIEGLGSGARQRLSGQLAALVAAYAHIAPSVEGSVDARAASGRTGLDAERATPGPATPSRRQVPGRRRTRARRVTLVSLLIAATLAGSAYVVVRDPDTGDAGALGGDRSPSTAAPSDSAKQPTNAPRPRRRAHVEVLAERQAGPITAVEVQPADGCGPGGQCAVTVTVRFRPAPTTQAVVWRVGTAPYCASRVTWSPPITVTAEAGWTSVFAVSSVPVPRGRSLALVALTTAPARAQSPPVPVTGTALRC